MVRETRSEHDEFCARLATRSPADRQRIVAEHRAYLNGDSATDADFGDDKESAGPAGLVTTQKVVPAKKPAYLPPPRGKDASYLAAAKKKMEDRLAAEAAAAKRGSVGKKGRGKAKAPGRRPVTKKQAAEDARREKKEKEAKAMARAEAAASRRAAEKERERTRAVEKERSGAEARKQALADIQKARDDAARKRKTPPSAKARAKEKQRKKISPHVADDENDADDESTASASGDVVVHHSTVDGRRSDTTPSADTMGPARARAVRSLTMESSNDAEVETAVVLDADVDGSSFVESPVNGMDSDMDGDGADSEDWFVETEGVVQPLEDRGGPEDESDVVSGSDDGLDGAALLRRQKKRERLHASLAKLTRDWETTTCNWDTLTPDEMLVLA
ncbi:hypothetical protein PR003_g4033 [Phytophthora rubi]|uniref:Uncharacterized protein n=1 Tax=Phytophthora rubi TaxID=129364 RepID=A0A6A3LB62_9STRA|nr:hypothetical protein PR001_g14700 [Phytophthora rubi]KAE9353130.1 hypothetical protein PR003_g4033 [Phytophthora rubi]